MFDGLDETMKRDEQRESTSSERMIRYVIIAVASIVLFAGLYFSVSLSH